MLKLRWLWLRSHLLDVDQASDWCRKNGVGEIYLAYTQSFEMVNPAKFGFDAAILFSDILVVPYAMGQDLWFEVGEGPRLAP